MSIPTIFYREESVFRNAPNMTALKRRFKKKITTKGGKGNEQAKAEEEAKRRKEEAQRLAQEAVGWLHSEEEGKIKAAQEAAKKSQEAAKEAEEAAEEVKRNLDEELQKQEA